MQPQWRFVEPRSLLGEGAFSKVYRGIVGNNTTVAIKVIDYYSPKFTPTTRKYLDQEVEVMKSLQHPRLVQMFCSEMRNNQLHLVLEIMGGGELKDFIPSPLKNTPGPWGLPEDVCRSFMLDIASGMRYLSSLGLVHRDLKPQNILMSEKSYNATLKISDFGMARRLAEGEISKSFIGSPEYMSPEVLLHIPYGNKVDLWSLGNILYEMLTGSSPCLTLLIPSLRTPSGWTNKIKQVHGANGGSLATHLVKPTRVSALCWNLLTEMLQTNPHTRISWKAFGDHPYLSRDNLNSSTLNLPAAEPVPNNQPIAPPAQVQNPAPALVPRMTFTILVLTPQGRQISLTEKRPITMSIIEQQAQNCSVSKPLIMNISGEELTPNTLEKYLDGPSPLVYVVDQGFFEKEFANAPYFFPPRQMTEPEFVNTKDLVLLRGERVLGVHQRCTDLFNCLKERLSIVKKMWKTQHMQDRVAAVFSNHVWLKKSDWEKLLNEVKESQQSWRTALAKKEAVLKQMNTPFLMSGKTVGQFYVPETTFDNIFLELDLLMKSFDVREIEAMLAKALACQKANTFSALHVPQSRAEVNGRCNAAKEWIGAFTQKVVAFQIKVNEEKKLFDTHAILPANSPEWLKLRETLANSPKFVELEDGMFNLEMELSKWEKLQLESKMDTSTKVLKQVWALGVGSGQPSSVLRLRQEQLAKAKKLTLLIGNSEEFFQQYCMCLNELQRRRGYVVELNNQIETAKQQFEQMVKAEEICRQAFRQNNTNPHLAILNQEFMISMAQDPVPRPTIQYKATPLDPLPPVTAEVDKGLKEIQQQSEALKKNFARQIEKENANLTLTEQKLKTMQEKAKSPVPSTTTQYLATLQERVDSLNEQLRAQSTPASMNSLTKQIEDQKARNEKIQDHISKVTIALEAKPQIQVLETELAQIRQKILSVADPDLVKALVTIWDGNADTEARAKVLAVFEAAENPNVTSTNDKLISALNRDMEEGLSNELDCVRLFEILQQRQSK